VSQSGVNLIDERPVKPSATVLESCAGERRLGREKPLEYGTLDQNSAAWRLCASICIMHAHVKQRHGVVTS
jgi:hypothetical protein